jgi:hypothetical protein
MILNVSNAKMIWSLLTISTSISVYGKQKEKKLERKRKISLKAEPMIPISLFSLRKGRTSNGASLMLKWYP